MNLYVCTLLLVSIIPTQLHIIPIHLHLISIDVITCSTASWHLGQELKPGTSTVVACMHTYILTYLRAYMHCIHTYIHQIRAVTLRTLPCSRSLETARKDLTQNFDHTCFLDPAGAQRRRPRRSESEPAGAPRRRPRRERSEPEKHKPVFLNLFRNTSLYF